MTRTAKIFLLPLLISIFPVAALAEAPTAPGAVSVISDTLTHDKETAIYHALGNVRIDRDGTTLFSDKALYREADGVAEAEGDVRVFKGEDILRGDYLFLNLNTDRGKVRNGRLFQTKANFYLMGDEIQKVGKEQYHVERGVFTTCDGDSPSWKFTASDLDISLDEYAAGTNAIFYIKDIPVFYTPYILFPVKKERQSGFLIPSVGSSSKKGFSLLLPYYWAISASKDATFELDYQAKRGVGLGVEHRYIRRRGSEGEFKGYLINDSTANMVRGNLIEKHQEIVSPTFNIKSELNLVTDKDFFRDYGEVNGVYNQQILTSRVSITKGWSLLSMATEFNFIQDLQAASNRGTLQRLPTVTLNATRQKLGSLPLYFSMDSTLDNFYRETGMKGVRENIRPALTYNSSFLRDFDYSVWAGYRGRFYYSYAGGTTDGYRDDFIPDAGGRISTSLSRIYNVNVGEMRKLKHMLVPEVSYSYLPFKNQDALPFFDFNDRIVAQSMVTYSLASYLTAKFQKGDAPPAYRELLYLKLTQGYDINESRRDLLTLVDARRPFTDVRLEARVTPITPVTVSMDSRYNPYGGYFSLLNLNVDLSDGKGNSGGVGYRFAKDQLEYMEAKVGISLVKPFTFTYTSRYSFDNRAFLESLYELEYKHQCWSVLFTYRDRVDTKELLLNFTLFGIGPLGKVKAL